MWFDGPHSSITWAGSKTHPQAGRLRDFVDVFERHGDLEAAQWLREGIPFQNENVSLGFAVFLNASSCSKDEAFMDGEMQALQEMGALRVYDEKVMRKHGPPRVISSMGVAHSAKLHLIINLRYSNNADGSGEVCFDDIKDFLMLVQQDQVMAKVDLRSGYHHIPLWKADTPYLCVHWCGIVFYWTCLPFELRLAPRWFMRMTQSLRIRLRLIPGLFLIVYIDDFDMLFGTDVVAAKATFERVVALITEMGWVIDSDKNCLPALLLDLLGLHIDSKAMTVSLTEGRIAKLLAALRSVAGGQKVLAKQVAVVAGLLTSSNLGLWYGGRLAYLFYDMLRVTASDRFWCTWLSWSQRALDVASLTLANWDWLLGRPLLPLKPRETVVADSTPEFAGGAVVPAPKRVFKLGDWVPERSVAWPWELKDQDIIALKEARALVKTASDLRHLIKGKRAAFLTDNMVAMYVLKKGGSGVQAFSDVAWLLTQLLIEQRIHMTALVTELKNFLLDAKAVGVSYEMANKARCFLVAIARLQNS